MKKYAIIIATVVFLSSVGPLWAQPALFSGSEEVPEKKIDISAVVKAETKKYETRIANLEKEIGNLKSAVADVQTEIRNQGATTEALYKITKNDLAEIKKNIDSSRSKMEYVLGGKWLFSAKTGFIFFLITTTILLFAWGGARRRRAQNQTV